MAVCLRIKVAFCAAVLVISSVSAGEICRADGFYIYEDIDMFHNYTDQITFDMKCSQERFPTVRVTVEPRLQTELDDRSSRNGKIAFSISCTQNNVIEQWNATYAIKKSEPWHAEYKNRVTQLPLGQNCSIIGCYWDTFVGTRRRFAVAGSSCITNTNECDADPGPCEHVCMDTVESYECYCWPGYKKDNNSHNCSDQDECLDGTHNCSQTCINTEGSYSCSCSSGFYLDDDNISCIDIDECSPLFGENPCDHQCVNTVGGYNCTCQNGYRLNMDLHSCEDVDECDPESGVNQQCHECINTNGSFTCSCLPGHSLSSDKLRCLAAGECEMPQVCSQVCVNTTEGEYYCQCHSGYELSPDGHNCTAKHPLGDGLLVVYMPWAVPLALASLLLLLSLTLYYSIARRRKQGNILETNQDLYDFYLTQEKIDCTYEPVDLSHGLSFDAESIRSDVTAFHTTSNTTENLAKLVVPDETQILLVTNDPQSPSSEEKDKEKERDGGGGGGSEGGGATVEEEKPEEEEPELESRFTLEFNVDFSRKMSGDSCIGSSIAGDSSSGLHSSSLLCSPDTSGSSFTHSVSDTSANTDYIATDCGPADCNSTKHPLSSKFSQELTMTSTSEDFDTTRNKREAEEGVRTHDGETLESTASPPQSSHCHSSTKDRKLFTKTKDYIHATNALFGVINGVPTNTT